LVTKADGTKFGKTEAGSVWLDPARTSPYAFFQFWLRTGDAEVGAYLRRFTFLAPTEIEALDQQTAEAPERRQAQRTLASEVTAMVHGETEARRAEEAAAVLFTAGIASLDPETLAGALEDAPTTRIARRELGGELTVVDALLRSGLASSRRDARQLLSQGSVYTNGGRVADDRPLDASDLLHDRWVVLRRGRANQAVLVVID
jgi:tyrosyl-tRNA synthetase